MTHIVCATEPTYQTDELAAVGVKFTELSFQVQSTPVIVPNAYYESCYSGRWL